MTEPAPLVVVLGGPNGAGKSTCAGSLLRETLDLVNFVNADAIAQGLSGFAPESVAVEAGRIMLARLKELANARASFAFESTLSGRYYVRWLKSLREVGYSVHLVYCWLDRPELAVARVAERVRSGGHHVPEQTVRQRYDRSLRNLFDLYVPLTNAWKIYDNSGTGEPVLVAWGSEGNKPTIANESIWERIREALDHE